MKNPILKSIISLFSLLLISYIGFATTINPFPNLGDMGKHSAAIVEVKVIRTFTTFINDATRFRTEVEVTESVKGSLNAGDRFILQNHHRIIGDMESMVWGDLELEEGEEYLLFLDGMRSDYWQPKMLSYGAFIKLNKAGNSFFVPMDLGEETHFYDGPGATTPEELGVYKTVELKKMLKEVVNGTANWNGRRALSIYDIASFEGRGVPPAHCTFLSGAALARWPDFDTQDLPVSHHVSGDPGCATTAAEIVAGVADLNANYTGISLSNGGTHTFVPSCTGGEGATDAEFTTWVSANLGGTRNLVIQFDDPCDEITNLTGCNGTLAVGGLYWFSSTHTASGMTWRNAAYGYVIVNNGTGACQCTGGTDYQLMLEHEMSHALNIGHIAGSGTDNMNPNCCNAISNLDIECLDFIYAPSPLAIELTDFRGVQNDRKIELNWMTSMEVNNQFFTVEKRNELSSFDELRIIESRGDSDQETYYTIDDNEPNSGSNYYRLSHTDFSGAQTYVKTIEVNFFSQNSISIHPNPAQDQKVNILWKSSKTGSLSLDIFDLQGRLVQSHSSNVTKGSQQFPLSVENLGAGIYYVSSRINGAFQVNKLVIL